MTPVNSLLGLTLLLALVLPYETVIAGRPLAQDLYLHAEEYWNLEHCERGVEYRLQHTSNSRPQSQVGTLIVPEPTGFRHLVEISQGQCNTHFNFREGRNVHATQPGVAVEAPLDQFSPYTTVDLQVLQMKEYPAWNTWRVTGREHLVIGYKNRDCFRPLLSLQYAEGSGGQAHTLNAWTAVGFDEAIRIHHGASGVGTPASTRPLAFVTTQNLDTTRTLYHRYQDEAPSVTNAGERFFSGTLEEVVSLMRTH